METVMVRMGIGGLALGLVLLGLSPLAARASEACDGAQFQTVLQAVPAPTPAAQAYWLDRRLIQWPGQMPQSAAPQARYKLYHSAAARLRFQTGMPIAGADGFIELEMVGAALPAELAQRFKFIAEGLRLAVPAAELARLPALLKGQLLLVQEGAGGEALAAAALQLPGALDDWYAAAEGVRDLGASPARTGTRFKLWAPTAQKVALCRYASGSGKAIAEQALQFDPATGVWSAQLPADLSGQYYSYLVDAYVPGVGLLRNRVTDPYSLSLTTDPRRSYVADLGSARLKPAGWDATPRPRRVVNPTDMVIYELHVRDFSISDASVPAARRGKYLAFTESG